MVTLEDYNNMVWEGLRNAGMDHVRIDNVFKGHVNMLTYEEWDCYSKITNHVDSLMPGWVAMYKNNRGYAAKIIGGRLTKEEAEEVARRNNNFRDADQQNWTSKEWDDYYNKQFFGEVR